MAANAGPHGLMIGGYQQIGRAFLPAPPEPRFAQGCPFRLDVHDPDRAQVVGGRLHLAAMTSDTFVVFGKAPWKGPAGVETCRVISSG